MKKKRLVQYMIQKPAVSRAALWLKSSQGKWRLADHNVNDFPRQRAGEEIVTLRYTKQRVLRVGNTYSELTPRVPRCKRALNSAG